MRVFPWIVLALGVAGAQESAIRFSAVSQDVIEQRLLSYSNDNLKREPVMQRLFADAGCKDVSEDPVKGLKAPNLICALRGTTDREIIVGAHFDKVSDGDGVVDNWSGASLLPSLYQGLAVVPRRHSFRFVAFSGEERGLIGSNAYAREVVRNHDVVRAMVNMDTLGLSETKVWASHADPELLHLLSTAAASLNLPVSVMNVDRLGTTDSESFRDRKIPAITIHSVTSETWHILHSPKDRIEAIQRDEYYRTYRLVLGYLALLDEKLD